MTERRWEPTRGQLDVACGNDKTKLDPDDQTIHAAMTADLDVRPTPSALNRKR